MSVSFSYIDSQSVQDALEAKVNSKFHKPYIFGYAVAISYYIQCVERKGKWFDSISTDFDEILYNINRIWGN